MSEVLNPQSVGCPRCYAPAGEPCRDWRGHAGRHWHQERSKAAGSLLARDGLPESRMVSKHCPTCGVRTIPRVGSADYRCWSCRNTQEVTT